jgi:glycylpeptide N-tetradecanoyltransferase
MTLARMIRIFKVPSTVQLGKSLREMEEKDVPEVANLYTRFMERYDMAPIMTEDEVRHQFLSGKGTREKSKDDSRREGQVVWTYVVEVIIFV